MKLPFVLAKRFVAGESLSCSISKIKKLNQKGIAVTLDRLGENVTKRSASDEATQSYISLLKEIDEAGLNSTISVKLTMMGLDISPSYCKENLFELLKVAEKRDQFVRIDMEGSDHTEQTINLFKEAFEFFGKHVGIVIQAYLHRTKNDIADLANMGADVRLCKGAYKEPERIALQNMDTIRKVYKEYAKILLEHTPCPRIATHDDKLINWVKHYTGEHDIGKARFEFQMLYGLRQETMEQMTEAGYNTRIYVPYGAEWFPYFKRRLMERKENIWFVLTTLFQK